MLLVYVFLLGMLWGFYEFFHSLKQQRRQEQLLKDDAQAVDLSFQLRDTMLNQIVDAISAGDRATSNSSRVILSELDWIEMAGAYGHNFFSPKLQYDIKQLQAQSRQLIRLIDAMQDNHDKYAEESHRLLEKKEQKDGKYTSPRLEKLYAEHTRLLTEFTSLLQDHNDMTSKLSAYRAQISTERLMDPTPIEHELLPADNDPEDLDLFDDDGDFSDEDDDLLF